VERLRKQLPRELALPKGVLHPLRWTGGISAMGDSDTHFDEVLWRADQALIRAKQSGRNNTQLEATGSHPPEARSSASA
jgi:GGDEF domain-containing protein